MPVMISPDGTVYVTSLDVPSMSLTHAAGLPAPLPSTVCTFKTINVNSAKLTISSIFGIIKFPPVYNVPHSLPEMYGGLSE